MAQTTSARSAIIAASVSANPRIRHCKRDSVGRHRHHDRRQDRNHVRNHVRNQDSRHDRHQGWRPRAPTTRATLAEICRLGVTVARVGFASTGRMVAGSAPALPASSSSANTAVARRKRGSAARAASAAAWAMVARVRRTGSTASAATSPSGNGGSEASGSSRWPAAGLPIRRHRR